MGSTTLPELLVWSSSRWSRLDVALGKRARVFAGYDPNRTNSPAKPAFAQIEADSARRKIEHLCHEAYGEQIFVNITVHASNCTQPLIFRIIQTRHHADERAVIRAVSGRAT